MRIAMICFVFSFHGWAKPLTWDFSLRDTAGKEIDQHTFEDSPVTLVYIVSESVIFDKESEGSKSLFETGKAFARSLALVPAIFAVQGQYDDELFKSTVAEHTQSIFLQLSLYLRPKFKEESEEGTFEFISQNIRFTQDTQRKIAARFGIGRDLRDIPYRIIAIDSKGQALTLP